MKKSFKELFARFNGSVSADPLLGGRQRGEMILSCVASVVAECVGRHVDSKPHIRKVLGINTGHLKQETAKLMDDDLANGNLKKIAWGDVVSEGYLVWAGYTANENSDMPEEVLAACAVATEFGCDWVKYDCNADLLVNLCDHIYAWE